MLMHLVRKYKRMQVKTKFTLLTLLIFAFSYGCCQNSTDTTTLNKKRLLTLSIATGATYSGSMIALHQLWYKDFDRQPFQFFNDNREWKQMDKWGHFYSAFQLSHISSRSLQWTGLGASKSDLIGAIAGFAFLLPIEIFDGYSAAYGASAGDLAANALGSVFYISQKQLWDEIRIHPKFSFGRTDYAALRPSLLGDSYLTELFKDYNGQTFWLSVDMDKFMRFPSWLNIAFGYGADGMVYANDQQNTANGYTAYRQFFIALDPDLSGIKTRSKALNTVLFVLNMIKIPAPTIEFNQNSNKLHLFYF